MTRFRQQRSNDLLIALNRLYRRHSTADGTSFRTFSQRSLDNPGIVIASPDARDKLHEAIGVLRIYTSEPKEFSETENEVISGLSEIGSIGIENARMHDHLKTDYDRLITDVHHWFDFGRKS